MQHQSNSSAAELAAAVRAVSDYDFDRPRTQLVELERLINATHGNPAARLRWLLCLQVKFNQKMLPP